MQQPILSLVTGCIAVLSTAGCATTIQSAYWAEGVSGHGDTYSVTATLPDATEAEVSMKALAHKCLRMVLQTAVDRVFSDFGAPPSDSGKLSERILSDAATYARIVEVLDKREAGEQLAMKAEVAIDRGLLTKVLTRNGLLRNQQLRTIIVFRDLRATGADGPVLETGHIHDFSENLSREVYDRGFEPRLWQDVRIEISRLLDRGDVALQSLFINFIENSDWRQERDERYALPMLALRTQGRMLIGVSILELMRSGLSWHTTMRADIFDLFNNRSLGAFTTSGHIKVGSKTLLEARQELVMETARKAIQTVCTSLQEFVLKENSRRRKEYHLTFTGYTHSERNQIEAYAAAVLQEDLESSDDGENLSIVAKVSRSAVPVRREMSQLLEMIGCPSAPPIRRGNLVEFPKL